MRGVKARRIYGALDGIEPGTMVMGIGTSGQPEVALEVDANGKFSAEVGEDVDRWFAVSQTARQPHGSPRSREQFGDCQARCICQFNRRRHRSSHRGTARGEGGTLNPNFGPDYRGSGAGESSSHGDAEWSFRREATVCSQRKASSGVL